MGLWAGWPPQVRHPRIDIRQSGSAARFSQIFPERLQLLLAGLEPIPLVNSERDRQMVPTELVALITARPRRRNWVGSGTERSSNRVQAESPKILPDPR
jgi:hypothetical protein